MDALEFVKVKANDVEALRDLSIATFVSTYAEYNTKEDMENYITTEFSIQKLLSGIESANASFYFAVADKTPLGYIKVNYAGAQTDVNDGESLELERIYVLPEYQGKKIGQFLLNAALNVALRDKKNYLWLGVWDKNTNAQQFYAKNGFTPFGTHSFMLGNDEQLDILMKITLV